MNEPYVIGEWAIDPGRGLVSRAGVEVRLEPKSIEVLSYLASRPGEVVSRADLLDSVWPEVIVGDEVITNTIAKIRRTLEDDPKAPKLIETIPKRGYRLLTGVLPVPPPMGDGAEGGRLLPKYFWPSLAGLFLLLLVVALAWSHRWGSDVSAPDALVADEEFLKPSIAVLPFVNMSGDEDQEYFSDGLTEDLITDLSKISSLTVISRSSTFSYKGKSPDVRVVAKDLGVRYVVEGSVRKTGNAVRITAQLIDAESGKHLWAERYDRELVDIFNMQDTVRDEIVSALAVKLSPDEKRRLSRHISKNSIAYDLYLQALRQESYFTKATNSDAQQLFLKAIEQDPEFSAAYAHLAQTYSLAVENGWAVDPGAFKLKAVQTAQRAIQLDPELPYAYWSLGRIYTRSYVGDQEGAKSAFRTAISLSPNFADGYIFLAYTHIYTGDASQALGLIEKAMKINPRYPFWYLQALGMAQFFLGNYDESVQLLEQAVERNPNVPWLRRYLVAGYGRLGRNGDADWQISELESLGQVVTIQAFMSATSIQDPSYRNDYEDALRLTGLAEQ